MCTVSWRQTRAGYDLFFNRDELHSRQPEFPPTLQTDEGITFVAPRDGECGGTWLLTNEYGVTICLLNDYANSWRPAPGATRYSRGHIVLSTAPTNSLDEIVECVERHPLAWVAPFWLLGIAPKAAPLLLHWNGITLVRRQTPIRPAVLTSSSFETAEVTAVRLREFCRRVRVPCRPTVSELAKFHRQHDPSAGAYSVAMHRSDAATRSFIHVAVNRGRVSLDYQPAHWPSILTLSRSRRAKTA